MKFKHSIARFASAALVLSVAGGCTHMKTVSVQPAALPAGQVLPHRVALVLNQELADYKHEYQRGMDKFVYAFGDPLQSFARQVAGKSFQQVDEVKTMDKATALTADDLILVPRAVKSDVSVPVWSGQDVNLTLVVEWAAKNRVSGNTVWLTTITANAAEPMGSIFNDGKHQKIMYQKLFDDLSLKSYNAFQEAAELRAAPASPAARQ